jgi:hypothetical protein
MQAQRFLVVPSDRVNNVVGYIYDVLKGENSSAEEDVVDVIESQP